MKQKEKIEELIKKGLKIGNVLAMGIVVVISILLCRASTNRKNEIISTCEKMKADVSLLKACNQYSDQQEELDKEYILVTEASDRSGVYELEDEYQSTRALMFKKDGNYYKSPEGATFYYDMELREKVEKDPIFLSPEVRCIDNRKGGVLYYYLTIDGDAIRSPKKYTLEKVYE